MADAPQGVGDGDSSTERFVHLCYWSGQPDIYIPYVRLWTYPFWWPERLPPLPRGVFRAERPGCAGEVWGLYAFEDLPGLSGGAPKQVNPRGSHELHRQERVVEGLTQPCSGAGSRRARPETATR